jgi:asparagine synthase (glutamine-hydrolysing)
MLQINYYYCFMSAIFGVICKNNQAIDENAVNQILDAIHHRQTDGHTVWQSENAALGFCKLTVYPQQRNEELPVEAGDIVLTADARIDNRDQLYSLLRLDKQQWQHEADSLLILKSYQKWGERCVEHLEGEFVFAVWNKVSRQLFIAADQVGFRPVFYYDGPEAFIFCSEIKGIVAAKTTPNYFNEEHLVNYHFRQSDPAQTYNKEIFALCGGNTLLLKNHHIEIKKYWTLEPKGRYNFTKDEDWIACMRNLFYKAVEKRLNPDIPVGVTLSGGLDSGSVACVLAELLARKNKPLYAFSSVLPLNHGGVEQDERQYIDIINKHCPNIIQTFVEAPNVGPFDDVEDAFEKNESIPNSFFYMDRAIFEAAQQKGVRCLFTGFGGDFWVSWQGWSVVYLLMQKGEYNTARRLLKQLSANYSTNILSQVKSDYVIYTWLWKQLRKLKPNKGINWQQQTTLRPELVNKYKHLFDFSNNPDHAAAIQQQLQTGRISCLAGMFANRNAYYNMATADPMFDKDLMEFLIEAPIHLFNHNGWRRGLIRHAMDGILPSQIQWRRDKLPYNPDFAQRSIDSKSKLYTIMEAKNNAFIFDKYIDKKVVFDHFDDLKPFAGFSSPSSVTGIRMLQAGISCKALNYLNDNNYRFD